MGATEGEATSTFAMNLSLAVAAGQPVFGYFPCKAGPVLHLALRDTKRQLNRRLEKTKLAENAIFATEWPTVKAGGLDNIADWLHRHNGTLVVVDMFMDLADSPTYFNTWDPVNRDLWQLQDHAKAVNATILFVHHVTKRRHKNPFDTLRGGYGLQNAADTLAILQQYAGNEATLSFVGRSMQAEYKMSFNLQQGLWTCHGPTGGDHV